MFSFFKKLFGVKTPDVTAAQAPYKVEAPVVETQITDSVTITKAPEAAPVKKNRRPRNRKPKTANPAVVVKVSDKPKTSNNKSAGKPKTKK